jgi:hypothetical protein
MVYKNRIKMDRIGKLYKTVQFLCHFGCLWAQSIGSHEVIDKQKYRMRVEQRTDELQRTLGKKNQGAGMAV